MRKSTPKKHKMQFSKREEFVPTGAMTFTCGLEFGENGPDAKSAPITIKARSGEAINHWYFGPCVHDFAGMKIHKDRLVVDYCHDWSDVLGFINHFNTESGDLIVKGALVPFKDSDRTDEILTKAAGGVPYEASIFFGEGATVEEVPAGEDAEANGRTFHGPVLIFRKWDLRGVAVCPYGADMNTSSEFSGKLTDGSQEAAVNFVTTDKTTDNEAPKTKTGKGSKMTTKKSKTKKAEFDAEADEESKAVDTENADDVEDEKVEADESKAVDTDDEKKAEADDKAVDADDEKSTDAEAEADESKAVDAKEETSELSDRDECKKFVAAFGAAAGGQYYADGLSFEAASAKHAGELKAENEKLKNRLAAAGVGDGESEAIEFQASDENAETKKAKDVNGQFANLSDGHAKFAAGIKMPQAK